MVNYKNKYLEMKLKYINAKNKLSGGRRGRGRKKNPLIAFERTTKSGEVYNERNRMLTPPWIEKYVSREETWRGAKNYSVPNVSTSNQFEQLERETLYDLVNKAKNPDELQIELKKLYEEGEDRYIGRCSECNAYMVNYIRGDYEGSDYLGDLHRDMVHRADWWMSDEENDLVCHGCRAGHLSGML